MKCITIAKAPDSLNLAGWTAVVRQSKKKGPRVKHVGQRSSHHDMAWLSRNGLWQCTECGIRSSKSPSLGEPTNKCFWHAGVASRADSSNKLWCGLCGCYATGSMVGLDKPCKGPQLLSPSRFSLGNCRHPVTREVLGKPMRYRTRSCWKDRLRRWEEPGPPWSPGTITGYPLPASLLSSIRSRNPNGPPSWRQWQRIWLSWSLAGGTPRVTRV